MISILLDVFIVGALFVLYLLGLIPLAVLIVVSLVWFGYVIWAEKVLSAKSYRN